MKDDVTRLLKLGKRGPTFTMIFEYLFRNKDDYRIHTYQEIISAIGEEIPVDQENPKFLSFRSTLNEAKTVADKGYISYETIPGIGIRRKPVAETLSHLTRKRVRRAERQMERYLEATGGKPIEKLPLAVLEMKGEAATWARRVNNNFSADEVGRFDTPQVLTSGEGDGEDTFKRRAKSLT